MSAASLKFVERLRVVYGDPVSDNVDQFMKEYARILNGYTEAELESAADTVFQRHKGPHRWPRIPECVACAEEARERIRGLDEARRSRAPLHPDWTDEARARADKLIDSEIGRQAAREGWITPLWDYCRRAGQLPTRSQIPRMIAEARRFDEAYAECCAGKGALADSLKVLGDSMLERRDRLSAIADPTHRNPAGSDA